jgi:putative hydrolase of the HAD superfamily
MIKLILFDCDGLIIRHEKYFSVRLAEIQGKNQSEENQAQKAFFNGIFLDCEVNKADLKEELKKDLHLWNWQGSVEDLMHFWFSGEANIETNLRDAILSLRKSGYKCFMSTNNEKYRVDYLWNTAGLKNIFDGCFASSTEGYFKAEQEFWQSVHKHFPEIKKEEVLVLDDDQTNVNSAKQFGFNAEFYSGFEDFTKTLKDKYKILY